MDNKIYKYLFIGEYMFSLEYLYSDFTKGYTKLGLYWIGINGKRYEINVYYVKLLGNLFGKIELDKDIDRDIRQWLKKKEINKMTEREKNLYYIYKECFCNYDLITVFENNWGWVYDKLRGEQEEQIPDIVLQVVAQWIKETY